MISPGGLLLLLCAVTFFSNSYLQTKGDAEATYNEVNLMQTVSDFIIAGTETTATTLLWALLYMVIYPDVQGKHIQRGLQL